MDGDTGILVAVAIAIFGWLAKITHMLTGLSERFVPRSQIDARFKRVTDDAQAESRERKEDMKEIRGLLNTIVDKIESKADK